MTTENNNLKDALEKAQNIIKAQQKEIDELSLNPRVPSISTSVAPLNSRIKQSA